MARSYEQICPIARTLDLVGERWTLLIVRELFFGADKFTGLQENLPGIPARVLSDRLKKLEEHGLVARQVYSEHPLRASYHLTELGQSLKPVLGVMAAWGMDHTLDAKERRIVIKHVPAHFLPFA
ncbi:MAG: helix-turn-helix domain-containing protein [Dehalococcoidia bacterium]